MTISNLEFVEALKCALENQIHSALLEAGKISPEIDQHVNLQREGIQL